MIDLNDFLKGGAKIVSQSFSVSLGEWVTPTRTVEEWEAWLAANFAASADFGAGSGCGVLCQIVGKDWITPIFSGATRAEAMCSAMIFAFDQGWVKE